MTSGKKGSNPPQQITCLYCGQSFERVVYPSSQSSFQFCSPTCRNKGRSLDLPNSRPVDKPPCTQASRSRRVTIMCAHCREEFTAPPSQSRKYCSRKCYWEAKRKEKIECICSQCGKTFISRPSRNTTYCSWECYAASRQSPAFKKTCPTCNTPFEVPAHKSDQAYCSRECVPQCLKDEACHTAYICEQCGKSFEDFISQPRKYCSTECAIEASITTPYTHICTYCGEEYETDKKAQQFCSTVCAGKAKRGENHFNWSGGHPKYYGPNWKDQRYKVLQRDNHTCQLCGYQPDEDTTLDVHHIVPLSKFDDGWESANSLDNLISLCHHCHMLVEYDKVPCPDIQA